MSNNNSAMEPVAGSGGASLELGHDCYAAIDLGSNSFHLVISRYRLGEFLVMERQRKVVRLAAGLDENNVLSTESADKALVCLAEFSQLLVSLPSENIRAVGTNALRRLHGKNKFLEQAEHALGHSIEIIAGREEARLIYLGVSKWSVNRDESRMVIDIGGGSTEVIVGKGDATHIRESLEIGCVVLSKQYFVDGELNQQNFDDAILAAKLAIQPVVRQFQLHGWTRVIGCSGTMKSIELAMLEAGWSTDGIRKQGLQHLLAKAIDAGDVNRLVIPGVSRDRLPVFAGGLAILIALFDSFNIQEMAVSDIALREGVLYDLVGRSSVEDIRDVTVRGMLNRWGVDIDHGNQVQNTASLLYKQVVASWDLRDDLLQRVLAWSAQLHEVGLQISHDGYHKHGAYLLANADMAGFARRDQILLAALVSGHRRKFPLSEFESLPSALVTPAKRIAILLRIAVLLHRGRGSNIKVNVVAHANGQRLELKFDERWIEDHPLTRADLKLEQVRLKAIGLKLIVR